MAPDIPDRWLDYIPVGKRILGTRFIAFKVPLREHIVESVKEDLRLSCSSLLKKVPNLGMIIDLTYTKRFYDPEFFEQNGLKYKKLMIRGHEVPPKHLVVVFNTMVHEFLRENSNNSKLIGVHCTHGLNRTGYLICNYMISEMQMEPNEAIKSFNTARGHQIERQNYINSLTARSPVEKSSVGRQEYTNWRTNDRNPTSHLPNTTSNWRIQTDSGRTNRHDHQGDSIQRPATTNRIQTDTGRTNRHDHQRDSIQRPARTNRFQTDSGRTYHQHHQRVSIQRPATTNIIQTDSGRTNHHDYQRDSIQRSATTNRIQTDSRRTNRHDHQRDSTAACSNQ